MGKVEIKRKGNYMTGDCRRKARGNNRLAILMLCLLPTWLSLACHKITVSAAPPQEKIMEKLPEKTCISNADGEAKSTQAGKTFRVRLEFLGFIDGQGYGMREPPRILRNIGCAGLAVIVRDRLATIKCEARLERALEFAPNSAIVILRVQDNCGLAAGMDVYVDTAKYEIEGHGVLE
jgi:hypothetical protein